MINKPKLLIRSLKEVFFACRGYNVAMAVCLLVIGLMPAINVFATGQLVSIFAHPTSSSSLMPISVTSISVTSIIVIWGVSMLLPNLLDPLISYLQSHINQLVTHQLVGRIIAKNASFNGLQVYDSAEVQDTTAVLKSQSRFRPTNFSVSLVSAIREGVTVLALSAMLFSIQWWIPIVVLLTAIPLAYINFRVASFSWKALMQSGKHSRLMDYFSSLSFLREAQKDSHLFNAYGLIINKYNTAFTHVYDELKKAEFKTFIQPIPFQVVSVIVIGIVLYSLYEQSQTAAITVASVVVLLQSIFMLNSRMDRFIQYSAMLYETLDYFDNYFSFLATSDALKDGTLDIEQIRSLEFVQVSFKYPNTDTYILKDISFYATAGESIAIVGHNGAGKSTLVHLICRFWDVTEGQILVNGQDIRLYKVSALRDCIGAVFQDFFKFNMSIKDNIAFGHDLTLSADVVKQALQLPDAVSMDTLIGKSYDGIELSGGQWQKLAILRGLNANSSMIILDEPTSAIDPKAEVKLYEDFKSLTKGKLSFMITHRLGSVNGVDRILVIDEGRLVQDDTPIKLKNSPGVFKELWRTQADMYV